MAAAMNGNMTARMESPNTDPTMSRARLKTIWLSRGGPLDTVRIGNSPWKRPISFRMGRIFPVWSTSRTLIPISSRASRFLSASSPRSASQNTTSSTTAFRQISTRSPSSPRILYPHNSAWPLVPPLRINPTIFNPQSRCWFKHRMKRAASSPVPTITICLFRKSFFFKYLTIDR